MNRDSTLGQTLSDSLWSQHQDNASRCIALSDRAFFRADKVKTILCGDDFACNDALTRTTPQG